MRALTRPKVAIMLALAALRFAWVWLSFRLTLFRARDDIPYRRPDWRLLAAMSFAGVRGAITLAGVLTIPLTLTDGTAFPARDLAIFLAAGVIIVSLILASIGLPLLLRGLTMPTEPSKQAEEDAARVAAAQAAISAIENVQHKLAEGRTDVDIYAAAGARIMDLYRERIDSRIQQSGDTHETRKYAVVERDLRLAGLKAERDAIFLMARRRSIGSEIAQKLIRELDLLEVRFRV